MKQILPYSDIHLQTLFKTQIQQNKDWNPYPINGQDRLRSLRRKSNRIRIETIDAKTVTLIVDEFKTQIQQNKDWNIVEIHEKLKSRSFKTQIQQNKDWNQITLDDEFTGQGLRRKSNRIRIETKRVLQ